ncbi:GldG family protein [Rhodanobacter sp. DHG33]|uniref:GldG family protein n=1 Tax=Rhodanobacter sp. DHG33 TaxID=2775921 RepID=UPI00177BE12E|nr:GldG family protein [Rhodanobacter sp. DHG33]MBD8899222.1 GldG family protein [Rhodanobacter sp. DHG33]
MARMQLPKAFTSPLRVSRRAAIYAALALLTLVFVSLIVSSGHWLRVRRIDLTADRLYTLSPGTVQIVEGLQRPIRLTLYFSEHATRDLPKLRSYEQRVRDTLQEIAARSHGRVQLQVIDPVPYSDDEASAESVGLTPFSGGSNGERVFFGLAGSVYSADVDGDGAESAAPERSLAVPFFDPTRESFLEYDIAKLLYELNQPSKQHIGVISSLPVEGNPVLGQQPWVAVQQLDQLFDVQTLDPASLKQVGKDISVLLLIHPKHLSDDALYAIDQYVLRGGHLVVFVDPDAEMDDAQGDPAAGALPDRSSDLPRLFAAWGVRYDPHAVVLDRSHALSIELGGNSVSHPAMLGLDTQQLNRDDVVTASLQRLDLSTAGHFDLEGSANTRLIPLLQSTTDAEVMPVQRVLQADGNPSLLLQDYKPDNTNYVLAARLRGSFVSAFPERAKQPGHLAQSAPGDEVILVADTDLLSDRLWVVPQTMLGQVVMQPFANNGEFLGNLVDNLSGSSALLSIRGRSTSQRPFTRVEALRSVADQKFLQKEQELERELAETRQRLEELQPGKVGSHAGSVGAEQRQEIEQFRRRQLAINKELRDVQHQLNAEIDALGIRLKVINIVLVPALVALLGLLYGWRRTRRNRRRR